MVISQTHLNELDHLDLRVPFDHFQIALELQVLCVVGYEFDHVVTNECLFEGLENGLFHDHIGVEGFAGLGTVTLRFVVL